MKFYDILAVLLAALLAGGCLHPAPPATPTGVPGPTGIAGMVVDPQGGPAAGSYVYAYRSAKSGLRGPAEELKARAAAKKKELEELRRWKDVEGQPAPQPPP